MVAATVGTATAELTQIVRKNQSYEDFRAAVEENPLLTVEYVKGTIYMTSAPTSRHQMVLGSLAFSLHQFVKSRWLGMVLTFPLEVELTPQSCIVQAEILFIAHSRIAELFGEERITGAPDMVVAILEPNMARLDRIIKLVEYARAGVREYWMGAPSTHSIMVYRLNCDAYDLAGAFFSGDVIGVGMFAEAQIAVDEIFAL